MSKFEKLLSISSPSINGCPPKPGLHSEVNPLIAQLFDLLAQRNGFYAFEGALHVFPSGPLALEVSLQEWNSDTLWRSCYGDMTEGCLFFAEDIFGCQFCINGREIFSFDPETGELTRLASSIDEWANMILANYSYMTGHPLAAEWQKKYGRLHVNMRLVRIPAPLNTCAGQG